MASVTLTTSAFPAGTTVDIYPVSARTSAAGAPTGSKIMQATVDSQSRLFVEGLAALTPYYAVAQVAARWIWVNFTTDPEPVLAGATQVDLTDYVRYSTAQLGFTASQLGFFGAAPVARPGPYTFNNAVTRRTINADQASVNQLADLMATFAADLKLLGLVE